ncbi:MAG: hypothetical protein ACRDKE_10505 [Solirubrobacterales bacterium]
MLLRSRRILLALIPAAVLSLTLAATSSALTLDSTYGQSGTSPGFALPAGSKWRVVDSVLRTDGSIAILVSNLKHKRFGIYSVTAEGRPDPAFGPRGWRTGSISASQKGQPDAIAAYPDGRLLVVARRFERHNDVSAVVMRFGRDGKQDFGFARSRKDTSSVARRIAVKGRRVLPGDLVVDSHDFVIVSYTADYKRLGAVRLDREGRPDSGYGRLNQRQLNSADFSTYFGVSPESIALLPDNSVAIGGMVVTEECDDPELCPAGAWSREEPVVIRLSASGFQLRNFGGSRTRPRGARFVSTDFDGSNLGLSARPDGSIVVVLDSTYSFRKPGTTDQGEQTFSTVFRRLLTNGQFDLTGVEREENGLHDPVYPTPDSREEELYRNGYSIAPSGAIAVCGQERRDILRKGEYDNDHPGFIQVIDATSAADETISAANFWRTADPENAIEDCAWQSEGNLLAVDLNKTLTVSRYHP